MSKQALFIRHQAKPGQRDDIQRVWEKYLKPSVEKNPAHEVYYFCYDDTDPDVICVFQLYSDHQAMKDFMASAWYPDYLHEVSQLIVGPPQIMPATVAWKKK